MLGCMVVEGKYTVEEPMNADQIQEIQRGKTTKQEILEWFGPPIAIARKGTIVKVPSPGLRKKGAEEIHSDTFFELFSERNVISEHDIIYYYFYAESKSTAAVCVVGVSDKGRLAVDKLWILINEKTGIVEDYVYREQE
jgi:hypothetical protein